MQIKTTTMTTTRPRSLRPLTSGLLGIALLLPASFFMLTMLARICLGAKTAYLYIAPSFLQSPFHLFAFHKAQVIIGCLLLAVFFNVFTIMRFRLEKSQQGWQIGVYFRRYWLHAAIALQATLVLLVLVGYTCIQHIRY